MRTRIVSSRAADLRADLIAVPLHELDPEHWKLPSRAAALDTALGGRIASALASGDFRARRGQQLLLYTDGALKASRVVLIGLGPEANSDTSGLREAAGRAVREARRCKAPELAILTPAERRIRVAAASQALAEGVVLGAYRFDRYQTLGDDAKEGPDVATALLIEKAPDARAARAGVRTGQVLGSTDGRGEDPVSRRVTPYDFLATIFGHLGFDHVQLGLKSFAGRRNPIFTKGDPIPELTRTV